jgi:hypothetical protein
MTKMAQITAAVTNRTMRLPTAVPKTFAASLEPSDQPRNRPLERKMRIVASMSWCRPVSQFRVAVSDRATERLSD